LVNFAVNLLGVYNWGRLYAYSQKVVTITSHIVKDRGFYFPGSLLLEIVGCVYF